MGKHSDVCTYARSNSVPLVDELWIHLGISARENVDHV
jgi:hypothetical protein